jgi:2,4-dienoyl-CoA reductase-like NADH-dependent reductase (Old Yellow Enzyme family)
MTERISNRNYAPTERHIKLYNDWAATNAGLLITGNAMIDKKHLESAGNIYFDESILPQLRKWADVVKKNNTHLWVQISHAGRQSNKFNTLRPKAPSEVQLRKIGLFGKPRAMSEQDIAEVAQGFTRTARIAKEAGFTGVQVHSAHGYLLSQFLSPTTNRRTDQWGGSIQNRSRLLLTIIRKIREVVGPDFPVSVKLNSSDFQKGGLTEKESMEIIKMLDTEGIDLLEISGGTYEKVAFFLLNEDEDTTQQAVPVKESTQRREAYFMDFAKKVRTISKLPLMITGGFRTYDFCNEVLKNGELDLVGMARPFITNMNDIPEFLGGKKRILENLVIRTGIKQFEDAAEGGFYARQIIRMSKGKKFKAKMSPLWSSNFLILHEMKKALSKKF